MRNLANKYDPHQVEAGKYADWIAKGYFTAGDMTKKPYCIVIPPPNVTGKLHLGHAWDTTLQDIISRYKRMQGYDMLWIAGMDHAGIATQAKVDAKLRQQGISRYDLGRDEYLKHAWKWKAEYAEFIRAQWAKLGLSLDYTRERFTMDEGFEKAVKKVFVDLYEAGLIYQGERIINWDPQAKTALSNIEVIHKEIEGHFYTFRYQIVETGAYLNVATTRPETMFGDVCVVVNPKDERYQNVVGQHVVNPANHEVLPVIADDYIDIEFGTGAMKCTPAHDPNDFAIAERHDLAKPICIKEDGSMNELAGEFNGLDRFACRDALVERIRKEGNLVKIEKHLHQVGHSERTDVIVEPMLSKQWFVKMKPLADAVLKHQEMADRINFYPSRFEKNFDQWLINIEDWCISRQLWWGHRIPAYYHNTTGAIYVGVNPPTDMENYHQDEDVLDTWFSSALWPFATLGWPEDTADLRRYYPNNVLVTGYDIIFFWVARMAFDARYFTDSRPFADCLIHGLIRDAQGRKMSKSLGNGIDPMDVIDRYGVDSLRFFLTTNSTPGQDIRYSEEKLESSWNFINKLWNASRFVLMNLPDDYQMHDIDISTAGMIDRWIIERFNTTLEHVTANMDKYEFALVGNELYSFIWEDFCNWYIELSKSALSSTDATISNATRSTLTVILTNIIKLLHPFMPFVTEEIYAYLPHDTAALCVASWPQPIELNDHQAGFQCQRLIDIIKGIREIRVEGRLKPKQPLDMLLRDKQEQVIKPDALTAPMLKKMAHVKWTDKLSGELLMKPINNAVIYVPREQVIDREAEELRLRKEAERLAAELQRCAQMLNNPGFVNKAPQAKIAAEQKKQQEYQRQYDLVTADLRKLGVKDE